MENDKLISNSFGLSMITRLRLLSILYSTAALFILGLCIGSQNINDRAKINLGLVSIAPLPVGFITGSSLIIGVISGGTVAAMTMKK